MRPVLPSADWTGPSPTGGVSEMLAAPRLSPVITRNINEDGKNAASRKLPPERTVNANVILIKVLAELLLTHNYLICGYFSCSHAQAGNLHRLRGESLQLAEAAGCKSPTSH